MGARTFIQWTDSTLNWWIGCTKVSPGCAHCYAERSVPSRRWSIEWGDGHRRRLTDSAPEEAAMFNRRPWICDRCGQAFAKPMAHHARISGKPCAYSAGGDAPGTVTDPTDGFHRRRVFAFSLADWLDDQVPWDWALNFLRTVHATPEVRWQLLSKRLHNWEARMRFLHARSVTSYDPDFRAWLSEWIYRGIAPHNVWLGASIEDQTRTEKRVTDLLRIPAVLRWLSIEPLLGPVDLKYACFNGADSFGSMEGIHWVIVGGESGFDARPCDVAWIDSIIQQCSHARVPCFVKQFGAMPMLDECPVDEKFQRDFGNLRVVPTKKSGFRLLLVHPKGGDPDEWPESYRVLQFPVEPTSAPRPFALTP